MMARITVSVALCVLLMQCHFADVQAAAGDLGDVCKDDGSCTDTTNHVCDTNRATKLCKIQQSKDCSSNRDQCVAGATCDSSTKICKCSARNVVADGSTGLCNPAETYVGGACGSGCTDTNAECQTSKCQCSANYVVKYADYTCVLKAGQTGCGSDAAKCLDNGACASDTCGCADNYVAKADNTVCLKHADQSCLASVECLADGECTSSTCSCAEGFKASGDKSKCEERVKIGGTCGAQADCVTTADECSTDKKCACTGNNVATDDNTACKLKAGETCTADTECATNAECPSVTTGTMTCKCKSGFTKQTSGKCSGAAGITASVLLLMLATLVTSRLV